MIGESIFLTWGAVVAALIILTWCESKVLMVNSVIAKAHEYTRSSDDHIFVSQVLSARNKAFAYLRERDAERKTI